MTCLQMLFLKRQLLQRRLQLILRTYAKMIQRAEMLQFGSAQNLKCNTAIHTQCKGRKKNMLWKNQRLALPAKKFDFNVKWCPDYNMLVFSDMIITNWYTNFFFFHSMNVKTFVKLDIYTPLCEAQLSGKWNHMSLCIHAVILL